MKPIIPEFILNPQEDKKTDGHPYGQSYNVDDRMEGVFADISQSHYKIISEHRDPPVKRRIQKSRQRFDDLAPNPDSSLVTALGLNSALVHVYEIAVQIDVVLLWKDMPQEP
jgi:hypothetical protein